jgi:uncharacterized coiled-coil DUF342 family protein
MSREHNREPIKHTCPDIDKYIKWIKFEIVKDRDLKNMDENQLFDTASSMSSQLESCIDYLEELRKSNDTLRQWGIEEANNADYYETKFYELQSKFPLEESHKKPTIFNQ